MDSEQVLQSLYTHRDDLALHLDKSNGKQLIAFIDELKNSDTPSNEFFEFCGALPVLEAVLTHNDRIIGPELDAVEAEEIKNRMYLANEVKSTLDQSLATKENNDKHSEESGS